MEALLGDRYRLGPVIGSGGMGDVYRARDERLRRDVAVKVLRTGAGPQEAERMRREASYLAGLHHPNLVGVLDAGTDDDRAWFAMELVEGRDLRHELEQHGALPPAGVRHLLRGAAAALAALHREGVVHRDLKPANLLLADDGEVKVADLGIAHLLRSDHLTTTGQVMGTVAYLSPEQVAGRDVGTASDVYALGLVVLEALTGRVAFPGVVAESAAARLVRGPAIPAWISGEWRALLEAMTALDPADRPSAALIATNAPHLAPLSPAPTARIDGAELGWAAADRPTQVLHVVEPRRRRRLLVTAASLATAVVIAGGGFALLSAGSPSADRAAADPPTSATHRTTPSPSRTPVPTATPSVTPTASAPPTVTATPAAGPAVATAGRLTKPAKPSKDDRAEWREKLRERLRELADRRLDHGGPGKD